MVELMKVISDTLNELIKHGFGEIQITCKTMTKGDRKIIFKFGKTYKFIINKTEFSTIAQKNIEHKI